MLFKKFRATPKTQEIVEALWRLQKIILDTLDFNQVVEKIVNGLLEELGYLNLGYRIVVLTLVDEEKKVLKRISLSQTDEAAQALAASAVPFHDIDIPLSQEDNYLIKALRDQKPYITHYWPDIFTPVLTADQACDNQIAAGVKTSMVYPIIVKEKSIGVLIFSMIKDESEVSPQEKELILGFTDVVGVAVQNAYLYTSRQKVLDELNQTTNELRLKNRNLEILRKMDSIMNTTLDLKEMCQKIVDTIPWELGYDGALISLVDPRREVLVPTAISQTPNIIKSLKLLPVPMEEINTPLSEKRSMSIQALDLHGKIKSESLADAFFPMLPRSVSSAIQQIVGLKGIIVYPLFSKDKPIGVLSLAMHISPNAISDTEMNLLDAFMDEVGIALENAYLYEEAKIANAALEISNKKLIELDKMKDEFVSVASHELRTPMTAINGYVWMLLNGKGGELQEKQRYYLQRVAQSTSRLINLVNDMLTISRIEGGRTKIENKEFELIDLIRAVNEELQIKADEKSIKLGVESEDKVQVFADQDKVHEVLINLIGNALKFTDKGSITTTVLDKGDFISVTVTDTGKGISDEDMPKLFSKFGRLDNSYATVAETAGTGLGLFICKKYIEAMGGTITASSSVGKGSSFTFTLRKTS